MNDATTLFADGAAYEKRMGRWSRLVGEIFINWLAAPAGLRWLDVGCGNGAFTEVLMARCAPAAVSAVDPSEGQLKYARTRSGTASAEFRVGDAQALPYADCSFDIAAMALAISFIPDPLKAAHEMKRVVKPGGSVCLIDTELDSTAVYSNKPALTRKMTSLVAATMPNPNSARELPALARKAGLKNVEAETFAISSPHEFFVRVMAGSLIEAG